MTDSIAEKTAARLERFSADERARFASVAEEVWGKPVSLAPESFSDWETKDLQILYDVLGGMLLTQEAAPRFQEELQIVMKDTDLPSVVEFGRIDDNGC
ncbi:hypothetical protein [Paenibacillus chitinolyticus]|uniref:hypothetical protein n=1 Tax=Paenibacillus chitinolyticus TaxID=79263 RepID=UPI001C475973|nr:hypothetical protein [Paenibacillus chitinolyticus]MBV6714835.1 hypothetical protein [Paenibacillus chitinolyticus]